MTKRAFGLLAVALASAPLAPAGPQDTSFGAPSNNMSASLDQNLGAWRAEHGDAWRMHVNPRTGTLEMLYGGNAVPSFEPNTSIDADWFRLGREWIAATQGMHRVTPDELADARVMFLPLAQGNTTDKMTVRFDQVINGVPVEDGRINALFDLQGRLLSLHVTAAPEVDDSNPRPAFDGGFASVIARDAFRRTEGVAPNHFSAPQLVFAHVDDMEQRRWALAWQLEAQWMVEGAEPKGYEYTIDARTRQVLKRESAIHYFDVGGTIYTMATPGTNPDLGNPPTQQPMRYARVTSSSAGTTFTNANGVFTSSGVASPLNLTVNYTGTYNGEQQRPAAPTPRQSVNNVRRTANTIVLNPGPAALDGAGQRVPVGQPPARLRSARSTRPTQGRLRRHERQHRETCNAFFNGSSTNYYQAGGGCNEHRLLDVVAHETGHWLNVIYGTGNGSDGMGEGNADVFSIYIWTTRSSAASSQRRRLDPHGPQHAPVLRRREPGLLRRGAHRRRGLDGRGLEGAHAPEDGARLRAR
jgi:hypothetical protein